MIYALAAFAIFWLGFFLGAKATEYRLRDPEIENRDNIIELRHYR